jgi:hypothetical protein
LTQGFVNKSLQPGIWCRRLSWRRQMIILEKRVQHLICSEQIQN